MIGSDWTGKFDYLSEYCRDTYLNRTKGISSMKIRMDDKKLNIRFVGESATLSKF